MKYYKINGGVIATNNTLEEKELTFEEYTALLENITPPVWEVNTDLPPTLEERVDTLESNTEALKIILGVDS